MINFNEFKLKNGLRVIVHESPKSTICTINIMYAVGSRDENENQTGLAHLFEHLMFGGSINAISYDEVIQNVGGSSNAYTTTDITNYYCTISPNNLETGFWIESDRMGGLIFSQERLDVQKKVVIEEFKERYLNKPYGDAWLNLCKLAYTIHPYHWPVIGKNIDHIEKVTLDEIKNFFNKFYSPSNAVMVISGPIKTNNILKLSEKWFEPITSPVNIIRNYPKEPKQMQPKYLELTADVPLNIIYKAYHIPSLLDSSFPAIELLTDILGEGNSSILYNNLVYKKRLFNNVNIYTTDTYDPGLLIISGSLANGISFEQAEQELINTLDILRTNYVTEASLIKSKNNYEMYRELNLIEILNRSDELATNAILGNTNFVNTYIQQILAVDTHSILTVATSIFDDNNCSTIFYKKNTL